jgi:predicted molibdopterin-dependent oxidoreductase YjgC
MSRPTRRPARASRCLLTTGRILSQYNVGAQTRRTDNVAWHAEDVSRSIRMTPSSAASATAIWSARQPLRRNRPARHHHRRVAPGVVYTTFHHPGTQANVITTDRLGHQLPGIQGDRGAGIAVERTDGLRLGATNCPEYKVT